MDLDLCIPEAEELDKGSRWGRRDLLIRPAPPRTWSGEVLGEASGVQRGRPLKSNAPARAGRLELHGIHMYHSIAAIGLSPARGSIGLTVRQNHQGCSPPPPGIIDAGGQSTGGELR
jgi:hypothetical protein